jgi:hypothetical protein
MTPVIKMPFAAFFAADKKPVEFRDVVLLCLSQRRALSFRVETDGVVVEAGKDPLIEIRLAGQWTGSSLISAPTDETGVTLVLPLLFNTTQMSLPHDQLYTLGHSYRSIADLFARNLFLAVFRDVPIVFEVGPITDAAIQHVRAFRRQYFYILKAEYGETSFQHRNAEDMISFMMINAYLPVLDFANPLLRRGGEVLRASTAAAAHNERAPLKAEILSARMALLSQSAL